MDHDEVKKGREKRDRDRDLQETETQPKTSHAKEPGRQAKDSDGERKRKRGKRKKGRRVVTSWGMWWCAAYLAWLGGSIRRSNSTRCRCVKKDTQLNKAVGMEVAQVCESCVRTSRGEEEVRGTEHTDADTKADLDTHTCTHTHTYRDTDRKADKRIQKK